MADAMQAAGQLSPLRGGVVHLGELPVADGRARAFDVIRRSVATANTDPAELADLHAIDFGRRQERYAFGGGPRTCLGSHPARLEMRVVPAAWHRRIPEYELAPGGSGRVEWPAGLTGIDSLPLVFPPGSGRA